MQITCRFCEQRDRAQPDGVLLCASCRSLGAAGLLRAMLRLEAGAADGLPDALWQHTIHVRLRRGGESIQLQGRAGHHALRKLFQEAGTPPWIRERTPLIFVDDTLMAIGDQWLGDAAAFGPPGGRFSRIVWERPVS